MSDFMFDENIRCLNCRTRFSKGNSCPACGSFSVQSMEGYDSSHKPKTKKESVWYIMKINPKTGKLNYEFPENLTQNE